MRARINSAGQLEYERGDHFVLQRCICKEVYDNNYEDGRPKACNITCPLMNEQTIIGHRTGIAYAIECCKFTVKSTTPFYEEKPCAETTKK